MMPIHSFRSGRKRCHLVELLLAGLLIVFFASSLVSAASPEPRLYLITIDGMSGFIDQSGHVAIKPVFRDARDFSEGLAAVRPINSDKWGFIDKTGRFVIDPQFTVAWKFQEGLSAVRWEEQGRYGFIDKTGKVVLPAQYSDIRPFNNGFAAVRIDDTRVAFIDKSGAVVLQTSFDYAGDLQGDLIPFALEGAFRVGEKQHWGFMNQSGEIIIEPVYEFAMPFRESITPVMKNGKFGFIDKEGRVIVDFEFDNASGFNEGMAVVSKKMGTNLLCGFINTGGQLAIPLQFEATGSFHEGLAAVKINGYWGFIDKTGNMVIQPRYLNRLYGPPWKPVSPLLEFSEGLAVVGTEMGNAFLNRAGEIVIPPAFLWYGSFSNGLAVVSEGRQTIGYINKQGAYVWRK